MLTILTISLLVLNFLGMIFLMVKNFSSKTSPDHRKILETQKLLTREMAELTMAIDHLHQSIQQEAEQLRTEVQSIQSSIKGNVQQELLLKERYREIFQLEEQGLSAEQIAAKLNKGLGEVEFILRLKKGALR
ncbi:DUF6115 domain-containing protein [Neobacillus fumarioli]|uniref:DUF6115 domain-containing protein n=1 Tax=Neobacillus fumarioli TaxID=105229 RepID=UPI00082FDC3F|nr:hypothetical protein [Neobacillus fumarioli]